jgi:hypothetical protein
MLEDRVKYLEEKFDKEINDNKALMKRVVGFMRKEQEEKEAKMEALKKNEISHHSKKGEIIKDMMARSSDGGQGCSKNDRAWRK